MDSVSKHAPAQSSFLGAVDLEEGTSGAALVTPWVTQQGAWC